MSTAERYIPHYCVADYQKWEGDWELWGGVPVSMTPSPFGPHSKLLLNVGAGLKASIEKAGGNATALVAIDWIVSDDTVVRPDVLVVCGKEPEGHVHSTPAVVVEILSDATRERDLTWKRDLYQRLQVPFYMVVDPQDKSLVVFRLDPHGDFEQMQVTEALELSICSDCRLTVPVAPLLA